MRGIVVRAVLVVAGWFAFDRAVSRLLDYEADEVAPGSGGV